MSEEKFEEELNTDEATTKRNYKDSLFCTLFSEKKSALSLYNAVNGTDYTNAKEVEIVTLENSVFIMKKNPQSPIPNPH